MRVALKFALTFAAVTLASVVTYSALAARLEVVRAERMACEDLVETGRALEPSVRAVWKDEGRGRAAELVDVHDLADRFEVDLVDLDDKAPASSPEEQLARERTPDKVPATWVRVDASTGRRQAFALVPLRIDDSARVALRVSRPLPNTREVFVYELRGELYASLATGLLASIVAFAVATWIVTRPLSRVTEQARRVAEGDLSQRLEARGDDEVAQLQRELNAMCDALRQARDRAAEETRKRIEALDELRHLDRLRTVGQLASGIAHELGTPLNVILMRANMLAASEAASDQVKEQARSITQQTERVTRIVRQLMNFARRSTPKRHAVVPGDLAQHVATMLAPLARRAEVEIEVIDDARDERVWLDAGQIEQVLTNLIVNAIQASRRGSKVTLRTSIDVRSRPDGARETSECVVFSVEDRGMGIADAQIGQVFDPFYTTKEVGEGTGLGLPVAFGIVQDHGGWMLVESVEGIGSVFSAVVPVERKEGAS